VTKPDGKRILENFHSRYDEKTQSWIPEGIIDGDHIDRVTPTIAQNSFGAAIGFHFTSEGAARVSELTRIHKGRSLAIIIDDDIMQIAVIREQITSSGQLSGNFTDEEVKGIVSILSGGSLKARPKLVSERAIEPAK
jgi:preprotein translocase subunit SecD